MSNSATGAGEVVTSIDPSNLAEVQQALQAYLRDAQGLGNVTFVEPPAPLGRGFDTYIYSFRLSTNVAASRWSAPLVLRLYRTPEEDEKAARDAAVQRYAADLHYPTPQVLASTSSGNTMGLPFIIMARAPGRVMLERIAANPLSARRLLAQMAQQHVALHRLPVTVCPLSADGPLIDRQLESVSQRIARRQLQELSAGFDRLNRCKGIVTEEQATLCHGDFHPLNLVVAEGGGLSVLDWSDAALGDRHHDVARTVTLFSFAYIAAESSIERILLRTVKGLLRSWYFGPYNRALPVDRRRLLYWEAFHAFQGLLQLYEIDLDRPETLGSNPEAVRRMPPSIRNDVRRYFERKMNQVESGLSPIATATND